MRATSIRRRRSARATLVTGGRGSGSTVLAPPAIADGRVRCPVCRNSVLTTTRGYLRGHRDLFGHPCHNKALPDATGP